MCLRPLVLFLTVIVVIIAAADSTAAKVLGADVGIPAAAVGPTILDQIKEALGGLALLVITIVAAFVAKALPGLLEAARLWLIERATSERVQRLDEAIDVGLAAGLSPDGAADIAARKLPQTLKRSNKSVGDLTGEAAARREARTRQTTNPPAMKYPRP